MRDAWVIQRAMVESGGATIRVRWYNTGRGPHSLRRTLRALIMLIQCDTKYEYRVMHTPTKQIFPVQMFIA